MLMKKIFTLIATALMTLGVNAQSWNFSDWEVKEYTEPTEVNGLKINAASNKKISIDENSKTVDEVTYTKRLKFGGAGDATTRNIGFTASGAGTLKVILTSASSSDERTLGVSLGETEIGTAAAKAGVVETATIDITGAGTFASFGIGIPQNSPASQAASRRSTSISPLSGICFIVHSLRWRLYQ